MDDTASLPRMDPCGSPLITLRSLAHSITNVFSQTSIRCVPIAQADAGVLKTDHHQWNAQTHRLNHISPKDYSYDLKSLASPFHPCSVGFVAGKSLLISSMLAANHYILEAIEAEEVAHAENRETEWPVFPRYEPILQRATFETVREVMTTFVRRIYEHIAAAKLPRQQTYKLLQDYRASITSNASRFRAHPDLYPRSMRLHAYHSLMVQSTSLLYAAQCTVSIVYDTTMTVLTRPKIDWVSRTKNFLQNVVKHTLRCSLACWFASWMTAGMVDFAPQGYEARVASITWLLSDMVVSQAVLLVVGHIQAFSLGVDPPGLQSPEGDVTSRGSQGGGWTSVQTREPQEADQDSSAFASQ